MTVDLDSHVGANFKDYRGAYADREGLEKLIDKHLISSFSAKSAKPAAERPAALADPLRVQRSREGPAYAEGSVHDSQPN